jgi:hypothetical protein
VRGKLDYLDLVHLRLKDKVVSFMARHTVNKEDMLGLVGSTIVMLDEMV